MGIMSFGFLVHQFLNSADSSVYYGNLVPQPWSWILHVIQHFGILITWSGYLICEAFIMLINYHISEYYKSIDRNIGKVLKTWVSVAKEEHLGKTFHHLEMSKESSPLVSRKSIRPYGNEAPEDCGFQDVKFKPAMVNLITMRVSSLGHSYESVESHSREEFARLWDMFEEIENLVDEFNRLFSLIVLLTFSSYLLMVCGLLVPVMKIAKQNTRLALHGKSCRMLEAVMARGGVTMEHGITAWGFFTVKRETLLTFLSLIASYVVIMLQS
ncbi:uncharacterized protein LOC135198029 isoform X2 [Macrobrachium nipponense]|uniref:uncharacterized protein LOC135198029 isoform X2 n=1 Tax=Macrobrachium nipponense TaxID=159736 RepID=UPI0030C7E9EA